MFCEIFSDAAAYKVGLFSCYCLAELIVVYVHCLLFLLIEDAFGATASAVRCFVAYYRNACTCFFVYNWSQQINEIISVLFSIFVT